jgi:hypothetical protein
MFPRIDKLQVEMPRPTERTSRWRPRLGYPYDCNNRIHKRPSLA